MRYPEFLQENGTIGFVAPSFGCNIEPYRTCFDAAQKEWKRQGYKIWLGPNCYAGDGIGISNTPKACGEEFVQAWESGENDCLISCGGGELMCEILDYVDFGKIKNNRAKWFMGYSDNTNLTYLLATICDTASIYGPCAAAFGMQPWHDSLKDAMGLLTGKKLTVSGYPYWEKESEKDELHPLKPYHTTQERILHCFQGTEELKEPSFSMEGRLLGGCMDCLVNLLGTCYDRTEDFLEKYQKDGIIWFLESCDLNVFGIRRAMWQMEHAGWFRYVKGFLIGRPYCYADSCGPDRMGLDAYHAFLETASRKNVPVIMDADLGHLPPMMPLIVGSKAQIRVQGNDIDVRMRLA